MVMVTLTASSCGLSEVSVRLYGSVGLVIEGAPVEAAPVGGRPVPVSVSPHPVPAKPTSAASAASAIARNVRDTGIEGIRSRVAWMSEGEQHFRGGALVHREVA